MFFLMFDKLSRFSFMISGNEPYFQYQDYGEECLLCASCHIHVISKFIQSLCMAFSLSHISPGHESFSNWKACTFSSNL